MTGPHTGSQQTGAAPYYEAGRDALRAALAEALREAAHVCQHNPCTTCLIVSDEEFDTTVFGSAVHAGVVTSIEGPVEAIADALLPHVERFAAEQVATALDDAAEAIDRDPVIRDLVGRHAAGAVVADCAVTLVTNRAARAAAVLAADNDRRQG